MLIVSTVLPLRVVITSPYFVPDDPFIQAMTTAVLRGVDVHLVVSEQIDQYLVGLGQRSFYDELLEGGVRIHSYTKNFLHAKHVSIDDCIALIGSSNMDMRSFGLNSEISLMVHSKSFVAEMRTVELAYRTISKPLTLAEWLQEPKSATVRDGLARLTSALQ